MSDYMQFCHLRHFLYFTSYKQKVELSKQLVIMLIDPIHGSWIESVVYIKFHEVNSVKEITEHLLGVTLNRLTFLVFFWWSQVSRSSFNTRLDFITICWRRSLRHTWKSIQLCPEYISADSEFTGKRTCPWPHRSQP